MHPLDEQDAAFANEVRAHYAPVDAPPPEKLDHPIGRRAATWIDFYRHWRIYELADLASMNGASLDAAPTSASPIPVAKPQAGRLHALPRWKRMRRAFEWASWLRTAIGSSPPELGPHEILEHVQIHLRMTPARSRANIRNGLLTAWSTLADRTDALGSVQPKLFTALREDITHALRAIESLTGEPEELRAPHWSRGRARGRKSLFEALPVEEEMARAEYPNWTSAYTRISDTASRAPDDEDWSNDRLTADLDRIWHASYPVRRYCLALLRLHHEINQSGSNALYDERIVRKAERIDQLTLLLLHVEKVLRWCVRQRGHSPRSFRKIAGDQLHHILNRRGDGSACRDALAAFKAKVQSTASLYDIAQGSDIPLVQPSDLNLNSDPVARVSAAFCNIVIGRNYVAHHDCADEDIIYPNTAMSGNKHPGAVFVSSAATAIALSIRYC